LRLHAVVVTQAPQKAARRRREAALVEPHEADDVPYGGLGTRSLSDRTIHSAGCPTTFAASWPSDTSRPRDSIVAVERSHAGGSIMVMGCWGAIRMGGGRGTEGKNGSKSRGVKARTARGLERERQGQQTLSAEVKNRPSSAYRIYRPRGVLSGEHAPRALTAGEIFPH
jgi:hypothetical protein